MAVDVKKVLLSLGEENAKVIVKDLLRPLAVEFVLKSENKIDDIILPFLDMVEGELLKLVDKIDGEQG